MTWVPSFIRSIVKGSGEQTRIVYAWELPSIMRKHIVTGAMGSTYFILLSGMYLVAFGNDIGMKYWQWGLLAWASSFAQGFQLVSAYAVRRSGYRRSLWFAAALTGRVLRGCAILAGFVLFRLSPGLASAAFMMLLVLGNCFDAIATPPWISWLASIIPKEEHGRFMGRRSAWIAFANVCAVVPIGYAVDRYSGEGMMPALLTVFGFALALGIVDLLIHRTIPEPQMAEASVRPLRLELAIPLSDRSFRPWLFFNALWTFGMTLGGSMATIYFVENLGIRRNFFGGSLVLLLVPMVGTMVMGRWVGSMVDRHGVKPVMRWGHRLWAMLPLFWIAATPSTAMLWLGLGAFVAGLGSEAGLNAANKLITRVRAPDRIPMYTAVSSCVGSLSGGVGALIAGLSLQALEHMSFTVGGMTVVGFHVLFFASFVLRTSAILAIRRIPGRRR